MRWLTGFTGTNGLALVGPEIRLFVTDFRYVEQAQAQVPDSFEHARGKTDLSEEAIKRMKGRVGYDDASHFSRDYKRHFGEPPMRDVERMRETATA